MRIYSASSAANETSAALAIRTVFPTETPTGSRAKLVNIAAIAAAPAVDTMKLAKDGFVESTPPRGQLFSAQTPQVFKKDVYLNCLEKLGASADDLTDDSGAVALCGVRVKITEIKGVNFKITRPEDLALAKTLVESVSTR